MKVLGFLASPRKKGNTAVMLEQALAGALAAGAQVEKVVVADLRIAPCLSCYACERNGKCAVHDAMADIYTKIEEADAIIVASPVYFMGLPAQFKALVDRCQPYWIRKYILKLPPTKQRVGLFLSAGGTNLPHSFDAIRLEVKSFFHCLDTQYLGEVVVRSVSSEGAISDHPDILAQARQAGEELVRTFMAQGKA